MGVGSEYRPTPCSLTRRLGHEILTKARFLHDGQPKVKLMLRILEKICTGSEIESGSKINWKVGSGSEKSFRIHNTGCCFWVQAWVFYGVHSHAPSIRSHRGIKVVWPDFQPMRVAEEPVCVHLFRQKPVFTSLHLKSPVHVHRLG